MPEEKLIDQIRTVVREEIKVVREEVKAAEKRIVEKIDESQADTIQVLSDLIHTGFADHEERISNVEKILHISKN